MCRVRREDRSEQEGGEALETDRLGSDPSRSACGSSIQLISSLLVVPFDGWSGGFLEGSLLESGL